MQEEKELLLSETPLQNANLLVLSLHKKILKYAGKGLVSIDVLPKAMLTFALVERVLEFLSWGRFIPASVGAAGTYLAVYSLLSPYVATQLSNLPDYAKKVSNKIKSCDFVLQDVAEFPLYLIITILTFNAAYVFCGMQLEGVSSMADIFSKYSDHTSGISKDAFIFLSNLFSNFYFKWPVSLIDIPVTLLAYSAVHKHFIIDTPKKIGIYLKRYFCEPTNIANHRQLLIYSLDKYIKNLKNLEIGNIESIYKEICVSEVEKDIVEKVKVIGELISMPQRRNGKRCLAPTFELSKRVLALSVFFMGTYCMVGNVQTSSASFGLNRISNTLQNLMSFATRLSITAIWFENGYDAIEHILKAVMSRSLDIRLDKNWTRFWIFSLALLAGGASSVSVVQSTLIALNLNNIDIISVLGIIYILTAAFGTTIADGTPVFNSRIEKFSNSYKKKGDSAYKLYCVSRELQHIKSEIDGEKTETIASIANSKFSSFARKDVNIQIEKDEDRKDIEGEIQEPAKKQWYCTIL